MNAGSIYRNAASSQTVGPATHREPRCQRSPPRSPSSSARCSSRVAQATTRSTRCPRRTRACRTPRRTRPRATRRAPTMLLTQGPRPPTPPTRPPSTRATHRPSTRPRSTRPPTATEAKNSALLPRFVEEGEHGDALELDERARLEQPGDFDEAHRGVVRAHARSPAFSDGPLRRPVLVEIGHERQKLDDVLGAAAGRAHDVDHVVERRQKLRREVRTDDPRVLVESHLPRHVERAPGSAEYAVGVTARFREVRRVDQLL